MGEDRGEGGSAMPERTLWWFPSGGFLSQLEDVTPAALAGVRVRPFSSSSAQAGFPSNALWGDPNRKGGIRKSLQAFLESPAPLLHAVQDGSAAFQWALLDAASHAGYRHRVVSWSTPLQRLRAVVRDGQWTGIDSRLPPLLREDQKCQNRLAYLFRLLAEGQHQWEVVEPSAEDENWLFGLPKALGVHLRARAAAAQLPMDEPQEQLLRLESGWLTGSEVPPVLLRPSLVRPAVEDARVKLVRLEGIPPLLPPGECVQTHGMVVFEGTVPAKLELEQAGECNVLAWPRPSPALANKWPDLPAARQARFASTSLLADAKSPAHLRLRPDQDAPVPVLDVVFKEDPSPAIKGIFLARWAIGYQSIPKVACTSLKEALFRLATGESFGDRKRPGGGYIHDYFFRHEQDITQAAWRFVVVRDPIERFLSGFSNRVLHYRELSKSYLSSLPDKAGMDLESFPANPSLDQFIANFDFYCKVPTIRHHFSPISTFVAPLESYSRVYAFHEIDALAVDISQRTGQEFSIPHSQQGGPKLKLDRVKPGSLRKLIQIYESDYEMLKHLYQPPSL